MKSGLVTERRNAAVGAENYMTVPSSISETADQKFHLDDLHELQGGCCATIVI